MLLRLEIVEQMKKVDLTRLKKQPTVRVGTFPTEMRRLKFHKLRTFEATIIKITAKRMKDLLQENTCFELHEITFFSFSTYKTSRD